MEELYRRYRVALVRIATQLLNDSELANDVVHDVFVELLVRWDTIDPECIFGYLSRSVRNRALSLLRRQQTAQAYHVDRESAVGPGADVCAFAHADAVELQTAVRTLSRRQRQVIVLRYYQGYPVPATAAALGMSDNAVAVNVHRALAALRRRLR